MSKFNEKSPGTKTTNAAGGDAYAQSKGLELISILLTSFGDGSFYRSAEETYKRLAELLGVVDPLFAAKAIVYARTQFGMRTITHVAASLLAKHLSGKDWAKDFYKAVVYRPDDMLEIISYHSANKQKLPNSMKKGFAAAFDKFQAYHLGKYRGEGKNFKLVDVVNLVHPVPIAANEVAIKALVDGTLRSEDTWEVELTRAGQGAENEVHLADLKAAAWTKLITERKIGYFALLRNLRNIIKDAPRAVEPALAMLIDENMIKKSLVLPFRFLTAFDEIAKMGSEKNVRLTMTALTTAVDISLQNVPAFDGETLVVLDKSGSMNESHLGQKSPHVIGALFSAVLTKRNNCDFMVFSDDAEYKNLNLNDSTVTIANSIRFASGGTNFPAIFKRAKRKYDRVIILSDMQGWIGGSTPMSDFKNYKDKYKADPFIYSFDLKNYGTMQFPERNVFALAGFSEKVFDIMKYMEADKESLIKAIGTVDFKK